MRSITRLLATPLSLAAARGKFPQGRAPPITGSCAGILRNIEGTLWIDKQDYSWVKFEADVLKPFSIGLFLARVGEGTHLLYELMPLGATGPAGASDGGRPNSGCRRRLPSKRRRASHWSAK